MIKRIKIEFTQPVTLPGFSFAVGDNWEYPVKKVAKGGFRLGGAFVHNNQFKVVGYE